MQKPDTRFATYLRAFFGDLMTAMSGPASVPFVLLALWVSSRAQKILFGCLAVLCALFATYRVWRRERLDTSLLVETVASRKDAEITTLNERIAELNERISELSRKPYSDELKRITKQVIDCEMTLEGRHTLRHLIIREPIEVGRVFIPEVPQDRQHAQLGIAMQRGLVQHREQMQGSLLRTYWIINPRFRPVLEDLLYEGGNN